MSTQLKLTYFDLPARAEVTRVLLHYGNIDFEDKRLGFEEFGQLRDQGLLTLPFNQLPVLEIGKDTTLVQSEAIERYAARIAGLIPQDPIQAAQVDMSGITTIFLTPDEGERPRKHNSLYNRSFRKSLAALKSTQPKTLSMETNQLTRILPCFLSSNDSFVLDWPTGVLMPIPNSRPSLIGSARPRLLRHI